MKTEYSRGQRRLKKKLTPRWVYTPPTVVNRNLMTKWSGAVNVCRKCNCGNNTSEEVWRWSGFAP